MQEAGDLLEQRSCHGRWRFRGPQAAFAEQPNFLSTGLSCADESGAPRCVQNQIFALKKKSQNGCGGSKTSKHETKRTLVTRLGGA